MKKRGPFYETPCRIKNKDTTDKKNPANNMQSW